MIEGLVRTIILKGLVKKETMMLVDTIEDAWYDRQHHLIEPYLKVWNIIGGDIDNPADAAVWVWYYQAINPNFPYSYSIILDLALKALKEKE